MAAPPQTDIPVKLSAFLITPLAFFPRLVRTVSEIHLGRLIMLWAISWLHGC